jgi:hypothetical protein
MNVVESVEVVGEFFSPAHGLARLFFIYAAVGIDTSLSLAEWVRASLSDTGVTLRVTEETMAHAVRTLSANAVVSFENVAGLRMDGMVALGIDKDAAALLAVAARQAAMQAAAAARRAAAADYEVRQLRAELAAGTYNGIFHEVAEGMPHVPDVLQAI